MEFLNPLRDGSSTLSPKTRHSGRLITVGKLKTQDGFVKTSVRNGFRFQLMTTVYCMKTGI